MSADNYTICPACKRKRDEAVAAREKKLAGAYHAMTAVKYDTLKLQNPEPPELEHTLREDYELGVDSQVGLFRVTYSCGCSKCDFVYTFKHTASVPTVGTSVNTKS